VDRIGAMPGGRRSDRRRWPRSGGIGAIVLAALVTACTPAIQVPVFSPVASPAGAGGSSGPGTSGSAASPSPVGQDAAIAAFVQRVTDGLTYRVTFTGTATASANRLPVAGSMDVAGGDFASSFTYDYSLDYKGLGKVRVDVRAVRGTGYVRIGTSGWQTLKGYTSDDSNAPFAQVRSTRDVTLVGVTKVAGQRAYKISIADAVLIHPSTIVGDVSSERIDSTTLQLFIDDSGMPSSGEWRLDGKGRVQGQLQEIVYDLKLTFTKVGAKITIAKP